MRYVVTGGAGFIGSNLVNRLMASGHEVAVVDDFSTGKRENIENHGMVRFEDRILRLGDFRAEGVFHLGMPSSSPMYRTEMEVPHDVPLGSPHVVNNAVKATLDALNYATVKSIPVVYASSSSLYSGILPPHREDAEIRVTDFYTETRLFVERLSALYGNLYGTKTAGLRLFSVYGPNERHKGIFANTLTQFHDEMRRGRSPVIYGNGEQTRDFTHVDDVVEAFVRSMRALTEDHKPIEHNIYNVGTGTETSFNQIVGLLNEHMGTCTVPSYTPNPIGNYVSRTCADTRKALAFIGFRAKIPLRKGIKLTYKI